MVYRLDVDVLDPDTDITELVAAEVEAGLDKFHDDHMPRDVTAFGMKHGIGALRDLLAIFNAPHRLRNRQQVGALMVLFKSFEAAKRAVADGSYKKEH